VQCLVGTRSAIQIRSHAQKYFLKLSKPTGEVFHLMLDKFCQVMGPNVEREDGAGMYSTVDGCSSGLNDLFTRTHERDESESGSTIPSSVSCSSSTKYYEPVEGSFRRDHVKLPPQSFRNPDEEGLMMRNSTEDNSSCADASSDDSSGYAEAPLCGSFEEWNQKVLDMVLGCI